MKKSMLLMAMLLVSVMSFAKDYKTLVFAVSPQMRCVNCENKVKAALQQVDGVKEVQTCLQSQMVAVKYDGQKTSKDKLVKAFKKIGYDVKVADKKKCAKQGNNCDKKHKDCDKAKKECAGEHKSCDKAKKECAGEHKSCDKAKKECAGEHKSCDKAKKKCTGEHKSCDKAKKECTGEHGCDKAKKECGKK